MLRTLGIWLGTPTRGPIRGLRTDGWREGEGEGIGAGIGEEAGMAAERRATKETGCWVGWVWWVTDWPVLGV